MLENLYSSFTVDFIFSVLYVIKLTSLFQRGFRDSRFCVTALSVFGAEVQVFQMPAKTVSQ